MNDSAKQFVFAKQFETVFGKTFSIYAYEKSFRKNYFKPFRKSVRVWNLIKSLGVAMTTRNEKIRLQITALLGTGKPYQQIADAVGCCKRTVVRVAKEIKPAMKEIEGDLTEYKRLLQERLPIEKRSEIIGGIAENWKSNPFAALKATQRADDLDGYLTEKDKLKQPQADSGEYKPMFMLPLGTKVVVNISKEPECIDVTPEEPEEDDHV